MVAWLSEPVNTVKFARALRTGEALAAHHPALMLRNFLIDNDTARLGGFVAREALSLRTFAALDAFVRGDSLRQLKMNAGSRMRDNNASSTQSQEPSRNRSQGRRAHGRRGNEHRRSARKAIWRSIPNLRTAERLRRARQGHTPRLR
jgi:hypothetical protein